MPNKFGKICAVQMHSPDGSTNTGQYQSALLQGQLCQYTVLAKGWDGVQIQMLSKSDNFPTYYLSDVQRRFLVEFESSIALRNTKLFGVAWPAEKHKMVNNKDSHTHCIKNDTKHVK